MTKLNDAQKALRDNVIRILKIVDDAKKVVSDGEAVLRQIRGACPHVPLQVPEIRKTVCAVCNTILEGCLAKCGGACSYEPDTEMCQYCGSERHAVMNPPTRS